MDRAENRLWLLVPAAIGMIGVIVGATITSGVAYLGDRNARQAAARTAKRLVAIEVQRDSVWLDQVFREGKTPGPAETAVWDKEQGTLARYLSTSDWELVSRFYIEMIAFGWQSGCASYQRWRLRERR
jgi:hypothetical protein